MTKLTTDTLEWAANWLQPITGQESQTCYPTCKGKKSEKLSQHAKCRQAIPACIAKVIVYKGMQELRTVDKKWTSRDSKIAVGIRRA